MWFFSLITAVPISCDPYARIYLNIIILMLLRVCVPSNDDESYNSVFRVRCFGPQVSTQRCLLHNILVCTIYVRARTSEKINVLSTNPFNQFFVPRDRYSRTHVADVQPTAV